MLEVMIAILTITAFSIGTLQLMAFTALYKVRAERQAQANFWIQEDFEDVKFLASTLDVSRNPNGVNVDNHDLDRFSEIYPNVCSDINQGYARELRRRLPSQDPDFRDPEPPPDPDDYAIPASDLPQQPLSRPLPPLAETLVATREIVGKNYSLYRTFPDDFEEDNHPDPSIISTAQIDNPHRLRIDYRVQNQENDVIARSSVEVIPNASFKCP
ncbi:MAG: type 4 pilin [Microcystis sp.]|jgi:hypothetical protein|uniref:type 4 pilin n=1 Tax=Microcystis sp. TaxID=1127 RepID=UPI0022BD57DA|nr:type 4 pilin [Microcystis sp. LE17-20D]MCZ8065598.1 type 4 pilin [Microcystis sp. LE17-20D]MCZ8273616.1 type 4 pilin [Microcystis sp. LE19-4.1E]